MKIGQELCGALERRPLVWRLEIRIFSGGQTPPLQKRRRGSSIVRSDFTVTIFFYRP
jgi:hypothetical protein